jgi:predicted small lipoprotein YifL
MKHLVVLAFVALCASLTGCGTRPPLPPECEGALTPINGQASAATAGASNESRTNP